MWAAIRNDEIIPEIFFFQAKNWLLNYVPKTQFIEQKNLVIQVKATDINILSMYLSVKLLSYLKMRKRVFKDMLVYVKQALLMALQTAACLGLVRKGRLSPPAVSQRTHKLIWRFVSTGPPAGWHCSGSADHACAVCLCLPRFGSDGSHKQRCLLHSQCIFNLDSLSDKDKGSIPPHLSPALQPHSGPGSHTHIPCPFTRMNFKTFKMNRRWVSCQARAVVFCAYDGENTWLLVWSAFSLATCHLLCHSEHKRLARSRAHPQWGTLGMCRR